MPPRKRSFSSSSSTTKKSSSNVHPSQPAKFGIQHFFERHSQSTAAAASSTPRPVPSIPPPDDLPISPEVTKSVAKRPRFSPGMIIKQSQDDGGDEVTWKISPVNERLKSFAGKILRGDDSKRSTLSACSFSEEKNVKSSVGRLQTWLNSSKPSAAERPVDHSVEGECDAQPFGSADEPSPFKTPPSAFCGNGQSVATAACNGTSEQLDMFQHKKDLLELLDQVEDAISVEVEDGISVEEVVSKKPKLCQTDCKGTPVAEVCADINSTAKSFSCKSSEAVCHPSPTQTFLLLEVSEKHEDISSSGQQKPYKVLRLLDERSGHECSLLLYDEWFYSVTRPGDIVNVIGDFDSSGKCLVDRNNNLIILHPQVLVSGTRVASSFNCPRRTVLDERLKSAEHSIPALIGTLLHQIFQAGLLKELPTRDFLEEYAGIVIEKNIESIYACGVNEKDVFEELTAVMPRILNWLGRYKGQDSRRASINFRECGGEELLSISEVEDIEEMSWAPRYGLKGVIDASVRVEMVSANDVVTKKILPLEFKTGKATSGQSAMEHQAQVILYTLLMSERYLTNDINLGLLYYLHTDQTIGIKAQRSDLIGLIMRRNELATDLQKASTTQALPPMLQNMNICRSCRHLDVCTVYHKAHGGNTESSGLGDVFDWHVNHLKTSHCEFLRHWDRLIDLEARASVVSRKKLDSFGSKIEENVNNIPSMILDVTKEFSVNRSPKGDRFLYEFVYQNSLCCDAPIRVHGADKPPTLNKIDCSLRRGDYVILGTKSGRVAVAKGIISDIDHDRIMLSLARPLRLPGCSSTSRKEDLCREVWRIDKDEIASSYAVMRFNLTQLFLQGLGNTHLRKLVVDLEPPRFDSGCIFSQDPAISYVRSEKSLNNDQCRAIHKILTAKDYALILGMPGTGKTSTMVHAVKALLIRGASILLTSYTNSAIDNLLLKLKSQNIDFVRIGRHEAIHEDIRAHCVSGLNKDSVVEIKQRMDSARVVGVTCSGVNHSLLANRRFDICIMDEAGQTTLPVSLGPLMFASIFVLVGDPYQLPPLVQSVEARENGMGVSLFCRLSEAHPHAISALHCQYRMCAGIMELSNALIYGNRLRCGSSEIANARLKVSCKKPLVSWLGEILDSRKPVVFVNTDSLPALESRDNKIVNNPTEAFIISKIAKELLSRDVAADEIGIITPYNSQVDLIRRALGSEVEAHTIDRYQGRDKDCIILSFVRSNEMCRVSVSSLLGDWRRINVALTRAKKKLIMVGSCQTLSKVPLLKLLIEKVEEHGHILTLPRKAIASNELKKCSQMSCH